MDVGHHFIDTTNKHSYISVGTGSSADWLRSDLLVSPVPIASGGTGQTTALAAFNALSPLTTAGDLLYGGASGSGTRLPAGSATQVLHGGTTPSWSALSLTADVTGTLAIGSGGTGQTTANTALNALLPSQGSNSGKYLKTDGTNTSWASASTSPLTTKGDVYTYSSVDARLAVGTNGQLLSADSTQTTGLKWIAAPSTSPGGTTGQFQFNDDSAFGGSAQVYYDDENDYFAAGVTNTGVVTLSHAFAVGGGNGYLPPTSISGAISYTAAPAASASATGSVTYQQLLPDPAAFLTNTQVDSGGPSYYLADGTVSLSFYVAAYKTVDGAKLYTPGLTTIPFTDNSDAANFYIDLSWNSVAGATGYTIFRNGTYNGNTSSYQSIDMAGATSYQDDGTSNWVAGLAYPPTPNHLAYLANGSNYQYKPYSVITAYGVPLYSATAPTASITDDNRSQHPPASGSISFTAGVGSYSSNGNYTHSYYIWSKYGSGGYSASQLSESLAVPNVTLGAPGSLTAVQTGSGSYTANGDSFTYYVCAYKTTAAGFIVGPLTAVGFTDDGSTNPYNVKLDWTAASGSPTGYIVYVVGGPASVYVYNSQNPGLVLTYTDNASGWGTSYPYNMNVLSTPSSLAPTQNDAYTGYGPADSTNTFLWNLAAYWNTPLGKAYSAPASCQASITDNGDAAPTFGWDLNWSAASANANGNNPDGYQLWLVSAGYNVHALNTSQDVGNVLTFPDQNTGWGTQSYQINGTNSYNFFYQINLSWAAVTAITDYYITKAGGDAGYSYNYYNLTGGTTSLTDTDDSLWTVGGMNPPTPIELSTYADIHPSWSAVGGATFRVLRNINSAGYLSYYDDSTTSLIDGNGSVSFTTGSIANVANTLYQATGATRTVKSYSYSNSDAVYSATHADNSVTDDNSSRYYKVDWTFSNQPSDKVKLIINTTNGQLVNSPTLTYADTNGGIAYNSNTTVTPNFVVPKFYSNRTGAVVVDTLTASTYIDTPQIGTGTYTGSIQFGSGAVSTGTNSFAFGQSSSSTGTYTIAFGSLCSAVGNSAISIGTDSHSNGAAAISIGSVAIATGNGSIAIGDTPYAAGAGIAIGTGSSANGASTLSVGSGAITTGFQSAAFGYTAHATGAGASAIGFGCQSSGTGSFAGGYQANASATNTVAIGRSAGASSTSCIAIGDNATSGSNYGTAIGYSANANGGTSISIGFGASSNGSDGVAVGPSSSATGDFGAAFGYSAQATGGHSVAIGQAAHITSAGTNSICIGDTTSVASINATLVGPSSSISTTCSAAAVFGTLNTLAAGCSAAGVFGRNNTFNASAANSYCVGQGNNITGNAAYCFGQNNTTANGNTMAIGFGSSSIPANTIEMVSVGGILLTTASSRVSVNEKLGIKNTAGTALLELGTAGSSLGTLGISGNTSGRILVQPAAAAGSWTWTLPTTGGTNLYTLQTNGSGTTTWAAVDVSTAAITGTLPVANGGTGTTKPQATLFNHHVDAGNTTTTETTLYTDTTAASQLGANDDKIEATYGGVFVSSVTATRQIKIYFAGTAMLDTGALTLSLSSAWTAYVTLIRVSSTVVRYAISFTTEGAALAAYTAVGELTGLTLSGTNILKITGQAAGTGAATNDIVAKLGYVEYKPA